MEEISQLTTDIEVENNEQIVPIESVEEETLPIESDPILDEGERNPVLWAWQFSKKIVVVLSVFYFISQIYFCTLLYLNNADLGIMISEVNETFRVCIGGYLLKSGFENVIKIYTAKMRKAAGLKKEDPDDSDDYQSEFYG